MTTNGSFITSKLFLTWVGVATFITMAFLLRVVIHNWRLENERVRPIKQAINAKYWVESIQIAKDLHDKFPNDAKVTYLLLQARQGRCEELIALARQNIREEKWENAAQNIATASDIAVLNQGTPSDLSMKIKNVEQFALTEQIKKALARNNWNTAVQLAAAARNHFPNDINLSNLLVQAKHGQWKEMFNITSEKIQQGKWREALDAVKQLESISINGDKNVADLKTELEKRGRNPMLEEVRKALKGEDYDRAGELAEAAHFAFPDDIDCAELQESVKTKRIANFLAKAKSAIDVGNLQMAEDFVGRVRQIDTSNRVAANIQQQILLQKFENALTNSLMACATNDFDAARGFFGEAQSIRPESELVTKCAAEIKQREIEYRADQLSEVPRSIIRRAIEAEGGMELMEKYKKAWRMTYKGTVLLGQMKGIPYTCEVSFQYPDKVKMTIIYINNNRSATKTSVFDGGTMWSTINGKPAESSSEQMLDLCGQCKRILPNYLIKEDWSLVLGSPEDVNGALAQVIRVTNRKNGNIEILHFDKQSGFLLKHTRNQRTASGGTQLNEKYLGDYQKASCGLFVPRASTVYVDGRLNSDVKVTDVLFANSFDAECFAKPGPSLFQSVTESLKKIGVGISINGVDQ